MRVEQVRPLRPRKEIITEMREVEGKNVLLCMSGGEW